MPSAASSRASSVAGGNNNRNNNAFLNALANFPEEMTNAQAAAIVAAAAESAARRKRRAQKERTNENRLAALRARSVARQTSVKKKAREVENRVKQRRVGYNTSAELETAKMRELGRALNELKGRQPGTSLNQYRAIRANWERKTPSATRLERVKNVESMKRMQNEWMAEAKRAYNNIQSLRNAILEVRKARRPLTISSTRQMIRQNRNAARTRLAAQRARRPLFNKTLMFGPRAKPKRN